MGIRRSITLYNASTAGNGSWVRLDARYEEIAQRSVQGTIVAGDTITFQGITKDYKPSYSTVGTADAGETAFLAALTTADITNLQSYTANFSDIMNGNWTYIRVVKTGTTGTATVQGFI